MKSLVRIGFGDAMGILSGDIRSFSGNVNVNIVDHGEGLAAASSQSGNILDQLVVLLAANNPVQAQGQLVDMAGNLDLIRAEHIGIANSIVQVNLEEALHGTERQRSEFIDRGRGLF